MLAFLASTLLTIFIPFKLPDCQPIPTISSGNYSAFLSKRLRSVVVGLTQRHLKVGIIPNAIAGLQYRYSGMTFAFGTEELIRPLARERNISLPSLYFFEKDKLLASFPYPEDDLNLIALVGGFVSEPEPVETRSVLMRMLGWSEITLLHTPGDRKEASEMQYAHAHVLGPVCLLPVTEGLLRELEIEAKFAVFIKEDLTLRDCNDLVQDTEPVYKMIGDSDLTQDELLVAAVMGPGLTDDVRDFLFDVGLRFPSTIVGYASARYTPDIESAIQRRHCRGYEFVVFNRDMGLYFDVHRELPCQESFNKTLFTSRAIDVLSGIESGQLQPLYITEDPPVNESGPVLKVVGSTYEEFVMDESDSVILFHRPGCQHCRRIASEFSRVADELRDVKTLQFGMIDVSKNACAMGFPFMVGVPHVHVFPMGNKNDDEGMWFGRDRDSILRLLKYKGIKVPVEPAKLDKGRTAKELVNMGYSISRLPEEERGKAVKYMEFIGEEIGFNVTMMMEEILNPPSPKEPENDVRIDEL